MTFVSISVTFSAESRSRKGRRRLTAVWWSECGARGRWARHPRTRAAQASCLPALGPAREVHRWKWTRCWRGQPAAYGSAVHEAWPELSLRDEQSLGREPRWNAERRAAPAGAAPHRKVRRLDSAPFGVPLPFCLLFHLSPAGRGRERKRAGEGEQALELFSQTLEPPHPNPLPTGEREFFPSCAALIVTKPAPPPEKSDDDPARRWIMLWRRQNSGAVASRERCRLSAPAE